MIDSNNIDEESGLTPVDGLNNTNMSVIHSSIWNKYIIKKSLLISSKGGNGILLYIMARIWTARYNSIDQIE